MTPRKVGIFCQKKRYKCGIYRNWREKVSRIFLRMTQKKVNLLQFIPIFNQFWRNIRKRALKFHRAGVKKMTKNAKKSKKWRFLAKKQQKILKKHEKQNFFIRNFKKSRNTSKRGAIILNKAPYYQFSYESIKSEKSRQFCKNGRKILDTLSKKIDKNWKKTLFLSKKLQKSSNLYQKGLKISSGRSDKSAIFWCFYWFLCKKL